MLRCLRKKLQPKEDTLIFASLPIMILSESWHVVFLDFDKLFKPQDFRFHQWIRLLLVLRGFWSFLESVKSSDRICDPTFWKFGRFCFATILYPCCYMFKENLWFYSIALFLLVLCRKWIFFRALKNPFEFMVETSRKFVWYRSATLLYPCCYRLKKNPWF